MNRMRVQYLFLYCLVTLFITPSQAQETAGSCIVSRTKLNSLGKKAVEQRVYDNGLGDIVQETQSFPGSTMPDIIVRHEYDDYRRRTKTWLPVTSSAKGVFVSNGSVASLAGSRYGANSAPFSRTVYDGFLLSQPSAQFKEGASWQENDKKVSVTYSEYVGVGMRAHADGYMYTTQATKYLCTRTVDEDGCWSAEYTDFKGRLMISETSQGKTYYIYNAKGDIKYVLPPALSDYIVSTFGYDSDDIDDTDAMMQKYAYIYRYDNLRHCIYRKLPGCAPIYYVYDKAGNCILTQDGNQRLRGEWTYSIPDKFGRPCVSGVCHNSIPYSTEPLLQPLGTVHVYAEYDGTSVATGGYAVRNLTLNSQTLYTALYYDGYSFIGHHKVPSSLSVSGNDTSIDTSLGHGLQTGAATAILYGDSVTGYIYSAMYYDVRYNISKVITANHLGGHDYVSTSYSYTGKPSAVEIRHDMRHYGDYAKCSYTYDDADRLVKVTHKIDSNSEMTLQQNTYNALGQLTNMSNSSFVVSYTYDIHSWLKHISASNQMTLFEESLMYENAATPCYNGNIGSMTWKAGNYILQRYDLSYDNASRLVSATYTGGSNNSKDFSASYTYDCMGNITSLKRNGLQDGGTYGPVDNLTLSYDGNRLTSVKDRVTDPTYNNAWNFADGADSSQEYEYDENGNVTKDLNKSILSIEYNPLNLPFRIKFSNGNSIIYTYSADGCKLKAEYTTAMPATTKKIYYCSNLIIEDGKLQQINFEGDYATYVGSLWAYHYFIKDHLGNNRMVVHPSGLNQQPQVTNYYPYGGLMANSTNQDQQRYKYNGKELDRMHGLDWYDFGARWMDAAIGRWHSMDEKCEDYYDVSPYVFCKNNPMNNLDLDGRSVDWYQNNSTKYYTWFEGNGEKEGFTHIGGKGSVLGEFETIIDNILSGEDGLNIESLYSNGFTFDIAPNDKGGLFASKERGWDFFDEFINGTGPEFSVLLESHPYTKAIKNEDFVKDYQDEIRSRGKNGKYTNVGRPNFYPWQASPLSPMQFIGTYRYDGYSSKDGLYINNVVYDSKSITSLGYHIPFLNNHRRSQRREFGDTYQFYIWRSKK